MNRKTLFLILRSVSGISLCAGYSCAAFADTLPGPADVGRIKLEERPALPDRSPVGQIPAPSVTLSAAFPKEAKNIRLTLTSVSIEGATVFPAADLSGIYAPYLHREVTLDVVYGMAEAITERYRSAGYFLSRAYVPAQEIASGRVVIRVIEGYVGNVDLPDNVASLRVVRESIDGLVSNRPLTSTAMESFLLRLNDLPGLGFSGVLSTLEGAQDGAVKLTLVPVAKGGKGTITFDNYSSRYLGPNELSASYSASLLPLQQTTISGLSSLPADKLRYGTLTHTMAIAPGFTLEGTGGVTKAYPGYRLKPFEIDSIAENAGVALNWQFLRQRTQDLSFRLALDGRNVASDILHTPLTRDRIRSLRANASYDTSDRWHGYNIASMTVSKGIDGLGSSNKGDLNLSRARALPDYTKAEWSLSRLQGITGDWSLLASASGQLASGVLFSSEQFGYGGQAFGRAFDASDITGDDGLNGSLELRYGGWASLRPVSLQPFGFYDIGTVWNGAAGQAKRESGASAGLGLRFATPWHQSGNIGLAWPLTRDIATPVYGGGTKGPRILLQFTQEF